MGRTAAATVARERAHLLIRLAAIALGGTLVLLAGVGATSLAALVLVLYLAAAVSVRYYPPLQRVPFVVPVLDLAAVTGLVFALPLALGSWILYAFAIGVAALRSGPLGAVAATALAVVGYDAMLVARGEQARATDLWPVQALIAIGLVIAEIVWALGREDVDTLWSRIHVRALSGLTRQREPDEVLRALIHELARLQSVHGAWVWALGPDQRVRTTVTTGNVKPRCQAAPWFNSTTASPNFWPTYATYAPKAKGIVAHSKAHVAKTVKPVTPHGPPRIRAHSRPTSTRH